MNFKGHNSQQHWSNVRGNILQPPYCTNKINKTKVNGKNHIKMTEIQLQSNMWAIEESKWATKKKR